MTLGDIFKNAYFWRKITFILPKDVEHFTGNIYLLIMFQASFSVKVAFSVLFLSWQPLHISCKVTFLFARVGFKLLWLMNGRFVQLTCSVRVSSVYLQRPAARLIDRNVLSVRIISAKNCSAFCQNRHIAYFSAYNGIFKIAYAKIVPHIQKFAYIRTYATYFRICNRIFLVHRCFKTIKYCWRQTITGIYN